LWLKVTKKYKLTGNVMITLVVQWAECKNVGGKMVKYWLFTAGLLGILLLWSCGQTDTSQKGTYTESRVAYLKAKLSLTDAQIERVRGILNEEGKEIAKLQNTDSGDRRGQRREIQNRKVETVTKIEAVLEDSQKDGYKKLCALGVNDDNFVELQAKLSLTVDQSDSVAKIFANMRREMQAMRESGGRSGNREGRMMGMRAMREETDEAIGKVLTEKQKILYEEIQEERMEEMRRRFESRGGGGMWD
jgi:hypothetical protein